MSYRTEDMTFPELIRNMNQRIKFLENGNAGTKRNDIRLGEMLVSTDPVTNQVCIENLQSGETYCFGDGDEDAVFSYSGELPSAPGDVPYISPPHIMAQDQMAKEIVLSLVTPSTIDVVIEVSFVTYQQFGDTSTGTTIIAVTLPANKNVWVVPVAVKCPKNSQIYCELTDFVLDGTENLSVFVRFGTPSSFDLTETIR